MKQSFRSIEQAFELRLDLSIYARPAVMKALYRLQDTCTITYERRGKNLIVAFFPKEKTEVFDVGRESANALQLIQFEMLRYDTMRQTAHVRELLVGRALYATCIESDLPATSEQTEVTGDWREDEKHILESWSE